MHIITVYHRGYSVRLNPKRLKEPMYQETHQFGRGVEVPELLALYQLHFQLAETYRSAPLYRYQSLTAQKMYEESAADPFNI